MTREKQPTTPDGQPYHYGACPCNGKCNTPENVKKYGYCTCFCHADEYARMMREESK